jgi:uncharacterized membrane protein YeaQ/YmgE (transglycosylase-associated protein family)
MGNVLVFAVIGLLAGAAARLLYPRRQPARVLGTMLLGMVGALGGGLISWIRWPAVNGQFHSGNLVSALLGAALVIAFAAGVSYARRLGGYRETSP